MKDETNVSQAAWMAFTTNPADLLANPEVRKFFLSVLRGDLPAEQKYDKFVEFFQQDVDLSSKLASYAHELRDQDEEKRRQVVATAAQEAGLWKPGEILAETRECLRRAVRRLHGSQHRDGGWGYQVEISNVWATVYATLSLHRAQEQGLGEAATPAACQRGLDWLMSRQAWWSAEPLPPDEERNIYELAVVVRCLCETGHNEGPEVRHVISACMDRLVKAQNKDGGWDRSIWGASWPGETGVWSEVGATSFALQALACAGKGRKAVEKGIDCLARAQNEDGSWNTMISRQLMDRGARSVTKTCDALKGILAGRGMGIDIAPYQDRIARAVDWLRRREQLISSAENPAAGWGWSSNELSDLENTCHTLETLLRVEDASLPLLTSNATWLMRCQLMIPGSAEDGKWANNETPRITLSLLEFYRTVQSSPLFAPVAADG